MFKVVEIFKSIDGEGIRTGLPVTFIRLHGCNCRCSYCDTSYSYDSEEYRELSLHVILDEVEECGLDTITLTGGEPLIHEGVVELIRELLLRNFEVNIETNGSIDLQCLDEFKFHPNLIITMDWKSISSNMSEKMLDSNLEKLTDNDVLKFVVGNEEDLNQMKTVLEKFHVSASVFVSPVFGQIEPKQIVDYLLDNNISDVRVQLQLHKIIWPADMRGV